MKKNSRLWLSLFLSLILQHPPPNAHSLGRYAPLEKKLLIKLIAVAEKLESKQSNKLNIMKKVTLLFNIFILAFFNTPKVSADDNFQTVLDTIKSGSTVYIRTGEFSSNISYKLTDKKNIKLIFEKNASLYCLSRVENVLDIINCENISIINGIFKHIIEENEVCKGYVFNISNSSNIVLFNCNINGSGSIGINCSDVNALNVLSCYIHDNSSAAYNFCSTNKQIFFLSNKLENNGPSGDQKFANWCEVPQSEIHERELTAEEKLRLDFQDSEYQSIFTKIVSNERILVKPKADATSIINNNKHGLYYYTRSWEDPTLYGCYDRILMSFNGNNVNAYYFSYCDGTGGGGSILTGKKNGSIISGKMNGEMIFNIEMIPAEFKIKFNYKINGLNETQSSELFATYPKYSFDGNIKNIRESPTTTSKILLKTDVQKAKIQLIEIGNSEMIGNTFDFWYKVKINGVEGWLFGGLSLYTPTIPPIQ